MPVARGTFDVTIEAEPPFFDSGTGELGGITGTLQIDNAAGKHSCVLQYELR